MNITAEEAKKIMDSEEGYIILDTRTQEEYDEGHIPGAIVIPHDEIAEKDAQGLSENERVFKGNEELNKEAKSDLEAQFK